MLKLTISGLNIIDSAEAPAGTLQETMLVGLSENGAPVIAEPELRVQSVFSQGKDVIFLFASVIKLT